MLKIINRLVLFRDYLLRRTKVSGLPIELVIEATNNCNLRCQMCSRQKMKRKIGIMDLNLYRKIIDEISQYAELVYLHGLGEPLYHPKIGEMIVYAKKRKLAVGLSTNATLLTEDKAKTLLNSGLDYLIISIDAFTSQTYLKIRGGKYFPKVVKNVKTYLKLKRKKGNGPYTVIQFVKTKENAKEAKSFYRAWTGKGAEVVRIKPVIDLLKKGNQRADNLNRRCFYLWRQINMISWDGKIVTPCCMDSNGDYNLGSVVKKTVKELWNGPKLVYLRKAHLDGSYTKISLCKNCNYPQPSLLGRMGAMLIGEVTIKKVLPFVERLTLGKFVIYD